MSDKIKVCDGSCGIPSCGEKLLSLKELGWVQTYRDAHYTKEEEAIFARLKKLKDEGKWT